MMFVCVFDIKAGWQLYKEFSTLPHDVMLISSIFMEKSF